LLRHTSGSYLLKFYGDAGKVAVTLGNSARILEENYKNAKITAADCSKFWALGPKEVLQVLRPHQTSGASLRTPGRSSA
jgi:hypothetical protein